MRKRQKQHNITEEELRQLQAVQRDLIREVDRICKKCGIRYCMVGGTMLGAIRHSGHIPWDDDADIGFLRAEYEKFREACRTELDHEKYYMQDLRDTEGYRWGYGKLRRRGTLFVRLGQEFMPYGQGVSIDLMPFDGVPDSWLGRRVHFFRCFLCRKLLWSEVGSRTEGNVLLRAVYRAVRHVPVGAAVKSYQRLVDAGRRRRTRLVRILTFPTPKGVYGYRREWYTDLAGYRFGDMVLPGAKDYDGYLRARYGEYMEIPPAGRRKTHPVSRLELHGG